MKNDKGGFLGMVFGVDAPPPAASQWKLPPLPPMPPLPKLTAKNVAIGSGVTLVALAFFRGITGK